jgi:hypothetical protein
MEANIPLFVRVAGAFYFQICPIPNDLMDFLTRTLPIGKAL